MKRRLIPSSGMKGMINNRTIIAAAIFLLIVACSDTEKSIRRLGGSSEFRLNTVKLQCKHPWGASGFIGLYSFKTGELTPPVEPNRVDIVYYFDNDDCSQGALIGHDDRRGYLFPIGYKSWYELVMLNPPSEDMESVDAITPLTLDKEGLAFWVKTRNGEYVLSRIRSLQPVSYSDIVAGGTATLILEWDCK